MTTCIDAPNVDVTIVAKNTTFLTSAPTAVVIMEVRTMTRDEAINTLAHFKVYISGGGVVDKKANEAIDFAIVTLVNLPSADRPQGEWIGEADGYADGELVYDTWYCSNCGYVVDDEPPTWNYCPNCGCYNGGRQSD